VWKRVPDEVMPRVAQLLDDLAQLRDRGEELAYRELANDLARMFGVSEVSPVVVRPDDTAHLDHQVVEREPHLSERPAARRTESD
jgi:hypothetical protein